MAYHFTGKEDLGLGGVDVKFRVGFAVSVCGPIGRFSVVGLLLVACEER